jgi:hypothetical protein
MKTQTQTQWTVQDVSNSKHVGTFEIETDDGGKVFEVVATQEKLIFGGTCNVGLLQSGYILRDECETLSDTLNELVADLETFYRNGSNYTSRIVCNERM